MIYVSRDKRQEGPYSEEEVRRKISNGELASSDLGWRQGLANWTKLSELLRLLPPLPPTWSSASSPAAPSRAPIDLPPAVKKRTRLMLLIASGLGLLGAYFDVYIGRATLVEIGAIRSEVASTHWLVQLGLRWLNETYGHHAIEIAETAAHILIVCGIIGGLTSLLFFLRKHTKVLAVTLILCGIAPMFHYKFEIVGLPMALAGMLALFISDKPALAPTRA